MVQSKATTVEDYLDELPDERREAIPLEKFPDTYNKQPLSYIALAAQKNYNALYLMGNDAKRDKALKDGFKKAGKKLDMGKSCVRFKSVDELPLDVIGEAVAGVSPDELIAIHNKTHTKK